MTSLPVQVQSPVATKEEAGKLCVPDSLALWAVTLDTAGTFSGWGHAASDTKPGPVLEVKSQNTMTRFWGKERIVY